MAVGVLFQLRLRYYPASFIQSTKPVSSGEVTMSTPARELRLSKPTNSVSQGRQQLADWEQAQPENIYASEQHMRGLLEFYW